MKSINKKLLPLLLSLILAVALLGSASALAADAAVITVESREMGDAGVVSLDVTIENNPGFAAFNLEVSCGDGLTLTGVTQGLCSPEYDGSYLAFASAENITDDGVLFTLNFTVEENCEGAEVSIALGGAQGGVFTNVDQETVNVEFVSGQVGHIHHYVAGKCACGDVLPAYLWYYNATGPEYSISTGEEMAALADIVNTTNKLFEGSVISLTDDVTLPADVSWTPIGGEAVVEDLHIETEADFNNAIKQYKVIYDSDWNAYTGSNGEYSQSGNRQDLPYEEGRTYYRVTAGMFSGTFDGQGHTISGLCVDTGLGYAGLFGNVNGILKDFTVNGTVTFTGANGDYIGGVAGMLAMNGEISGVTSYVTVYAPNGWNVGGIAGFVGTPLSAVSATYSTVTQCVNYGTVTGSTKVGGIAGENAGTIELCVNNGAVNGTSYSSKNGIGGIVGRNGNNNEALEQGTIRNCYNTGAINCDKSLLEGAKWSGGIVGFNNALSSVQNCYSTTCARYTVGNGYSNAIIGKDEADGVRGIVSNNYALYDGVSYAGSGTAENETGILVTSEQLKALAGSLGEAYAADSAEEPINNGYPVLAWQTAAKPGEGYAVTLDNRTGTNAPAAITGLTGGNTYSGSVTFNVACDKACVVGYTTDGGATYTRLTAAANENGGYDFTVNVTEELEIVIAIKGDVDGNGVVNGVDTALLARANLSETQAAYLPLEGFAQFTSDVDGVGGVNGVDTALLARANLSDTQAAYKALAW